MSEGRGDDDRERSGTVARPSSAEDGQPHHPFRALLSAAIEHEEAALGLSAAYAELPLDERGRLLEAVIEDARAEGIEVRLLLARLCGVEQDERLSARLLNELGVDRSALVAAQRRVEPAPPRDKRSEVWLSGDASSGAAMLVRPLEGGSHDVLGLSWRAALGLEVTLRERVEHAELPAFAERLQRAGHPRCAQLEPSPVEFASDVLAGALWQHVRARGALPEVLIDFADVIG